MIVRLDGYSGKYRVVSIALDESTRIDLLQEKLDFIYVTENAVYLYPDNIQLTRDRLIINGLRATHNYDVYELEENGRLSTYYDDTSVDNYFFVTGKCNSNCIMCPSPDISRKEAKGRQIDNLIEIAKHIPEDSVHLTVTGGEPFMFGAEIFKFVEFLKNKFLRTEFLFLTNGRIFAIDAYVQKFVEARPYNCIVAIPIHGSNATLHDSITQAKYSFEQTIRGVKALLKNNVRIELRIVVSKLNFADINNIASLIVREMPSVEYVSIMAMEMTGSARVNKEKVWIPYTQAATCIEKAIYTLIENSIDVKLYNFPLCTVRKEFWPLCEKSISPDKVRYAEDCNNCKMKDSCGGIFAGTVSMEKGELRAIV